jgi:DNA-binding MarR family transcriptional regulator
MATEEKTAAARAELSPVDNLAHIAASANMIANAADSLLRGADAGVGLSDWALLQELSANAEPTQMARLGAALGVSRQRVQRQIEGLAETKLVTVQTTEGDKRSRAVSLTDAGRDALARVSTAWTGALAQNERLTTLKNLDGARVRLRRLSQVLARTGRAKAK